MMLTSDDDDDDNANGGDLVSLASLPLQRHTNDTATSAPHTHSAGAETDAGPAGRSAAQRGEKTDRDSSAASPSNHPPASARRRRQFN